jgi:hypothetical protein
VSRYAMMNGENVENVSLWDGVTQWNPNCEIIALADDSPVGPGWTRDGDEWVAPPQAPQIDESA